MEFPSSVGVPAEEVAVIDLSSDDFDYIFWREIKEEATG